MGKELEELEELLDGGAPEPEPMESAESAEPTEAEPTEPTEPELEQAEPEAEPPAEPASERDILLKQIEELSGRLAGDQAKPAERSPEVQPKAEPEMLPFLEESEYEQVIADSRGLNTLLNKVYNSAVERTLRDVPDLVNRITAYQIGMARRVDDFYKENTDLAPHRGFVGYVANEIQGQNPGWDYDKLFGETAKEVRKRLNLGATKPQERAPARKPAFAKSPGTGARSGKGSQLSEVEKDILELIS